MDESRSHNIKPKLVLSTKEYFFENISKGLIRRKVDVLPEVIHYLTELLNHFMMSKNLHEVEMNDFGQKKNRTLAELLLTAHSSELTVKLELLKKLGDRTLYISGFFADSLNRSLVDVDYYKNMGVTAYSSLSEIVKEHNSSRMFGEIANKFTELTDVLTLISQESMIKNDQSILRLYENYLKTGSELAKERLSDLGVIPVSDFNNKKISEH